VPGIPQLTAWLVLPAFLACSQTPSKTLGSPSIGVFMDFDSAPAAGWLDGMESQVQELLKPSGMALDWGLVRDNRGEKAFAGLVVLKFHGKCSAEGWAAAGSDFGSVGEISTLAFTRVDRGRVTPYAEVKCDEVRKALAYMGYPAGQEERQKALSRALARVVAHEIYHILAKTTEHAGSGLAKAAQPLNDLVSKRKLEFATDDLQAIKEGGASSEPAPDALSEHQP